MKCILLVRVSTEKESGIKLTEQGRTGLNKMKERKQIIINDVVTGKVKVC